MELAQNPWAALAYLVAGVCFILALRGLSSPTSSQRGNRFGMIGMTMALLIAGYEQSQIERAIEGSSWVGYFTAQSHPWFVQAMKWRQISGYLFAIGYLMLVWDLLNIGKRETRPVAELHTVNPPVSPQPA